MLKKIDILLVRSFVPPFIVTFFIALFVFVMQTLWLYIDDIAGKGVGFLLLVELVAYMSVSMVPMALPVAVLISSVMVLGNLAERYELSSFKSAGISLWRVMFPLMAVTAGIGLFSFFCSNYFIPVSNLKFKSRLHDIKNQKPALSLEESLFNDDFKGYSIRIGDKLPDNQTIKDVLLFDDTETNSGRMALIAADSGSMYGSADQRFFIMELYEGSQISEPKPNNEKGKRNYPMMRANFKQWTKVFDLEEFDLDRTDEGLFKSHHSMLSNRQLLDAIDSIDVKMEERRERFDQQTNRHFYFIEKAWKEEQEKKKWAEHLKKEAEKAAKEAELQEENPPEESPPKEAETTAEKLKDYKEVERERQAERQRKLLETRLPNQVNKKPVAEPKKKPKPEGKQPWEQSLPAELTELESIAATFPSEKVEEAIKKGTSAARAIRDQANSSDKSLKKTFESRVKHVFEFHTKFSMAVACFIFLFVGAPMGAIVRKGGFGWPLLISIIFFMLFVVIGIFSKNIAERAVIPAIPAAWLACGVIFPMGLVLTYWAMRDMGWSQVIDFFKIKIPSEWFAKKADEKISPQVPPDSETT